MPKALVVAEIKNAKVKKSSLEVIYALSSQGCEVDVIAFGADAAGIAADVGAQGAKKLLVAKGDAFKYYNADAYAQVVADAFKGGYEILSAAASSLAKDLFPTLSARLNAGLAVDCISLKVAGSQLTVKRPMLAGKYFAEIKFKALPALVTVRPNVLSIGAGGGAAASVADAPSASGNYKSKTVALEGGGDAGKVDLTEAERIVSGGRAMKSADNFKILQDMASVIGATVGASRAAVDSGFAPHAMQVGQTGKTVNPTLYIACGISGAIQHLAGMKTSKVIVAINTDPEAPIFQRADYGAIGDLFEVVPALTEEFKKLLAQG